MREAIIKKQMHAHQSMNLQITKTQLTHHTIQVKWRKITIMIINIMGLTFSYSNLSYESSPHMNMYNDYGHTLQHGIASKFMTIMECIAVVGGMDYDYFKRLTAYSNEYATSKMNTSGDFAGLCWSKITV